MRGQRRPDPLAHADRARKTRPALELGRDLPGRRAGRARRGPGAQPDPSAPDPGIRAGHPDSHAGHRPGPGGGGRRLRQPAARPVRPGAPRAGRRRAYRLAGPRGPGPGGDRPAGRRHRPLPGPPAHDAHLPGAGPGRGGHVAGHRGEQARRPGPAAGRRPVHSRRPRAGPAVGDLRRPASRPRLPDVPGSHLRRRRRAGRLTPLPRLARCAAGADGDRMGRPARPDQLLPGAVHRGRVSAGRRRPAPAGRGARRAGVLRRARRRPPGPALRGGQAGTPGHADRSGRVHGVRRRDPVCPRGEGGRHPDRRRVLVQERRPPPAAGPAGYLRRRKGPHPARPAGRGRLRARPAARQAGPDDLPGSGRGAARHALPVLRGRGCGRRRAGGQGRRDGGPGRGPPRRRAGAAGAGRRGRGSGRADARRGVPPGPGRGPLARKTEG